MPVDRAVLHQPFYKDGQPPYPCPSCGNKTLEHLKDTLHSADTAQERINHQNPVYESDWEQQRFSCLFHCSRNECREVVAVSGQTSLEEVYDEEYGRGHQRAYQPAHFEPPLTLYRPASFVPENVRDAICEAQGLILLSPPAAGNALRKALELQSSRTSL